MAQLSSEKQTKIDKEEECIRHRKHVLAFLRECEAETVNYVCESEISAESQGKLPIYQIIHKLTVGVSRYNER